MEAEEIVMPSSQKTLYSQPTSTESFVLTKNYINSNINLPSTNQTYHERVSPAADRDPYDSPYPETESKSEWSSEISSSGWANTAAFDRNLSPRSKEIVDKAKQFADMVQPKQSIVMKRGKEVSTLRCLTFNTSQQL